MIDIVQYVRDVARNFFFRSMTDAVQKVSDILKKFRTFYRVTKKTQ